MHGRSRGGPRVRPNTTPQLRRALFPPPNDQGATVIPPSKRKSIRLTATAYRQNHLFSITVATYRKYPWFSRYPMLAEGLAGTLDDISSARSATLYAWCIMPDHLHLLLQDPDVVAFVRRVKGKMTVAARQFEPNRKLWQRSFYDHAIRAEEGLFDVACYIFENPVRSNLVRSASDYPWSGSYVWPDWRDRIRPT